MKKGYLILLVLMVLSAGMADFNLNAAEEERYRTYLVNRSRHYVEYTIESIDYGIIRHAGILPPEKDCEREMNVLLKKGASKGADLRWVLKLDIPLGEYKICVRFLQEEENGYLMNLKFL